MFSALLVCVTCLAADPPAAASVGISEQDERPGRLRRGQSQDGPRSRCPRPHGTLVRVARSCTPSGSSTWRSPFLTDPAHATARGLLGLVDVPRPVAIARGDSRRALGRRNHECRPGRIQWPARPHGQLRRRSLEDRHVVRAARPQARSHRPPDDGHAARPGPRGRLEAPWLQETRTALGHRRTTGRRESRGGSAEERPTSTGRRCWPGCGAGWKTSRGRPTATKALEAITDPRAVPSVWATFAGGKASASKGRRTTPRADRFAGLDAGTGAPGRRQRFGRGARARRSGHFAAATREKSRHSACPPARPGARSRSDPLPLSPCSRSDGTRSARPVSCSSRAHVTIFSGLTRSMN